MFHVEFIEEQCHYVVLEETMVFSEQEIGNLERKQNEAKLIAHIFNLDNELYLTLCKLLQLHKLYVFSSYRFIKLIP